MLQVSNGRREVAPLGRIERRQLEVGLHVLKGVRQIGELGTTSACASGPFNEVLRAWEQQCWGTIAQGSSETLCSTGRNELTTGLSILQGQRDLLHCPCSSSQPLVSALSPHKRFSPTDLVDVFDAQDDLLCHWILNIPPVMYRLLEAVLDDIRSQRYRTSGRCAHRTLPHSVSVAPVIFECAAKAPHNLT